MSTIGGYTVFSIQGQVPLAGYIVEDLLRKGVAGKEYRRIYFTGGEERLISFTLVAGASAIGPLKVAYKALQSNLVTIVDDYGTTWYNIMVKNVHVAKVKPVVNSTTASVTHVVITEWAVEPAATYY